MPSKYIIIRIRHNPGTNDYDEIPTIWDADTKEEAEGIAARLNARTEAGLEDDCFTIASI
jgi:hypothetical protein